MKLDTLPPPFAYTVLTLGITLLLVTIATWLRFRVEIPVRDIITLLPLVSSGVIEGWGSIALQDWLAPISGNTHRVVVTRFLMLLDYTFLSGRNYAIYLSAWLSILLLVFAYFKATGSQDRAGRCFVAGLALIYLCSPTQLLNLINPINASWYVAFACSAATVLIVISAGRMLNVGWMLLACVLAALAAFSNFVGVVACLVLPVVALHQRSRLSVLVLALSVALLSFFFFGFESGAPAGTTAVGKLAGQLAALNQWPTLLQKIATSVGLHLGAPVSASNPVAASVAVLSSVLLIGYLWLVLLYRWFSGQEPGPRSIEFCLVMATICLGVSSVIPLARDVFNDPLSDRYQTTTVIYWLSVSCLIYFMVRDLKVGAGFKQALVLLACIPVLPVLGAFAHGLSPSILVQNREANSAQILGQMGANFFERRKGPSSRMRASHIARHMEFLSAFGFEPIEAHAIDRERLQVDQPSCDGFSLEAAPSDWPGVQAVRLQPTGISKNPFLSRLDVRGSNGELGRLHAHVQRDHDLRAIAFDKRIWRGFYRGEVAASTSLTLYVDPVIGVGYQCILSKEQV